MFGRDDVIAANLPLTASENFEGEAVVIHFERGTYFSLRGSAGTIWSLLQAPTSIAGIVAALDGQTRLPSKDVEAILTAFITKLAEHDLITSSTGPAERPVLSTHAATSFVEPPDLEVYTDLSELITMDPVHESDLLTGWPKARDPKKRGEA
jgi:Coenzyme PQQ synthesis protein D (PqqD)